MAYLKLFTKSSLQKPLIPLIEQIISLLPADKIPLIFTTHHSNILQIPSSFPVLIGCVVDSIGNNQQGLIITSVENGTVFDNKGKNDSVSVGRLIPTQKISPALTNDQDITHYMSFSDSRHYSVKNECGIIAAQTPFRNGLPFTMFYKGEIKTSGRVLIPYTPASPAQTVYPNITWIKICKISFCNANIIKLSNITDVLSALSTNNANDIVVCKNRDGGVYKVISGDKSKGIFAIDLPLNDHEFFKAGDDVEFGVYQYNSNSTATKSTGISFSVKNENEKILISEESKDMITKINHIQANSFLGLRNNFGLVNLVGSQIKM